MNLYFLILAYKSSKPRLFSAMVMSGRGVVRAASLQAAIQTLQSRLSDNSVLPVNLEYSEVLAENVAGEEKIILFVR